MGKIDKILSKESLDNDSFTAIISKTNIIKHKIPEKKNNPDFDNKFYFGRRKKVEPKKYTKVNDYNHNIKDGCKKLISQKIDVEEFKEILKKEGVNPDIEAINKKLRTTTSGGIVSYNELIKAIETHKKDAVIQPKLVKNIGRTENDGKETEFNLMMPENNKLYIYYILYNLVLNFILEKKFKLK